MFNYHSKFDKRNVCSGLIYMRGRDRKSTYFLAEERTREFFYGEKLRIVIGSKFGGSKRKMGVWIKWINRDFNTKQLF